MESLSEALKVNQTLIQLNLSENQIGNEGMDSLSHALILNQTLISLDLSGYLFGSKGIKSLSHALKYNQTLTKLDLYCDGRSYYDNKEDHQENVQEFIQSLKINKSIIDLYIDDNKKLNKNDQNEINTLIKRNLDFQKKLTKSVKVGNLQLFQELIQIDKIPLIYQSSSDDVINSPNKPEKNTIFHTSIFHNQTEFLFHLLFANNEKNRP
ncbi:leucine rich repeat family protein [Anaeramoeba flamelloides]|uniref:Leucine rich repeat family protein n=1 Tax=Anaeramoeba flamelloides TaxID=1746091 RepID=A0AAV7Y1I1_9EUKA|nr:leucine rich repeat family protein [Anaeramoeba flamelloides]